MMLQQLENHFSETVTTNGALAYKSTNSSVLDLFSQGGAMRNSSESEITSLFSKAFAEDETLALKTLFYLRDIKSGQGERRFFKFVLKHLAIHHKEALSKNLHLIPYYGRWDDMWILLDTELKYRVIEIIAMQLQKDVMSETPSLLAKWLPSVNASSAETKRMANIIIKAFKTTPKNYRKTLSILRGRISIVETKLTEGRYEDISYDKIPSKAGMIYRGAFFRNDEARYKKFLDSLSKGEVKVNSGTLYPSDIVSKIQSRHWSLARNDIQLFEGQWKNLPNYIGEKHENSIVMADVSGSMTGTPMDVSIALAMYIAERNRGVYHNHFMTFSQNPQLVSIEGKDIVEKVRNISRADWGMNTNIESALQTILDVAVKNNLPQKDMVEKLYIISDMQFDQAVYVRGNIFENMKQRFDNNGYKFPNIVFWNVDAKGNHPMRMNEYGVQLVSGYSPTIMKQLLNGNGKTPYDFMLDVIDSERYAEVSA